MKTPASSLFVVALLAAAALPARADTVYYVAGHADMGVGYEEGGTEFDMHYHFVNSSRFAINDPLSESKTLTQWNAAGVPIAAESSPGSIVTYVGLPTAIADSTTAAYLGIATGSAYHVLPAIQELAKPWLGFGSEELDEFVDSQGNPLFSDLTWKLDSVTGGNVAVWDGTGARWATALGSTAFTAPVGHAHAFWGFTSAGLYTLNVTVSGTLSGQGIISGTGTYTFQVGAPAPPAAVVPEPSSLALGGVGLIGLGLGAVRRRQRLRRESRR
jgi:surface-anchored protein